MAWISVTIIVIHCGLIFATGTPYVQNIANRNEKRVILVGSGPLPQYLIQSGFEILPIFGGLRNLNSPTRIRKRIDEKKSVIPKRVYTDKIAPFTSISRKKNIRRKSDVPIVSKPLKMQNRQSAKFLTNKSSGLMMKPFQIKNGKVGIPVLPPKDIVLRSPQIIVKNDEGSSQFPTPTPQTSTFLIPSNPQSQVKTQSFLPIKTVPPSNPPQNNIAVEKSFVPSKPYRLNTLRGGPLPDRKDPQLVNIVNNNQQIVRQLSSSSIANTGNSLKIPSAVSNAIGTDSPPSFDNDFANVATPLTVVYKKPPVEILKSRPESYSNPDPYAYGYETGDGLGTIQYRRESTNGDGIVKGNYGYKDFQGLFRQVNYVADEGGFHAVVKSNEPGIGYADSADVTVLADYSPS